MPKKLSYKGSGVDVDTADSAKRAMAESLKTDSPLVLNALGAFASLVDGKFPGFTHPILVCKTEEPGSKQLIAFQHDRIESICEDMVHHLINDIIVMGATPLVLQDLIVCGKLEKEKVQRIVAGIAAACRKQGVALTGGETSEQPGVLEPGVYVLGASGIGVVEKENLIDGSAIKEGDTVIALASSGLHTNGYTLVRRLMEKQPGIVQERIDGQSFLDVILTPHRCYHSAVKDLFGNPALHGMAHITGGGIEGNLNRILPKNLDGEIDASVIRIPKIFSFIKQKGDVDDIDMRRTFNLGVGLTLVVDAKAKTAFMNHMQSQGCAAYEIGKIIQGSGKVEIRGRIIWNKS